MAFEEYQKRSTSRRVFDTPTISLQKNGSIGINQAAFVALDEPCRVKLLYDRTQRMVGIRPAAADDPNGLAAIRVKGGKTCVVKAMGFFRQYDLVPAETQHYAATLQSDGMLTVDLKKPLTDTEEV